MDPHRASHYVRQTAEYSAFIPAPLPPEPPLKMDAGEYYDRLQAVREKGELGVLDQVLPGGGALVRRRVYEYDPADSHAAGRGPCAAR